jgi:hypothetical protein
MGKINMPPTTSAMMPGRIPTHVLKAEERSQMAPDTSCPMDPPK